MTITFENYEIRIDGFNHTLVKKSVSIRAKDADDGSYKEGDKFVSETVLGYFTDIPNSLNGIIRDKVVNSSSVYELKDAISVLRDMHQEIIDEFKKVTKGVKF